MRATWGPSLPRLNEMRAALRFECSYCYPLIGSASQPQAAFRRPEGDSCDESCPDPRRRGH
jgi:hypothetical protein